MSKNKVVTLDMIRNQKNFLNETEAMYQMMKSDFRTYSRTRGVNPNIGKYLQDIMSLRIRMELYKETSPSYHSTPEYQRLRKSLIEVIHRWTTRFNRNRVIYNNNFTNIRDKREFENIIKTLDGERFKDSNINNLNKLKNRLERIKDSIPMSKKKEYKGLVNRLRHKIMRTIKNNKN